MCGRQLDKMSLAAASVLDRCKDKKVLYRQTFNTRLLKALIVTRLRCRTDVECKKLLPIVHGVHRETIKKSEEKMSRRDSSSYSDIQNVQSVRCRLRPCGFECVLLSYVLVRSRTRKHSIRAFIFQMWTCVYIIADVEGAAVYYIERPCLASQIIGAELCLTHHPYIVDTVKRCKYKIFAKYFLLFLFFIFVLSLRVRVSCVSCSMAV